MVPTAGRAQDMGRNEAWCGHVAVAWVWNWDRCASIIRHSISQSCAASPWCAQARYNHKSWTENTLTEGPRIRSMSHYSLISL